MSNNPTWLDAYFAAGVVQVEVGGVPLPREPSLNFVGGASGTDNPSGQSTDVVVSGGSWSTVLDLDFTALPTQSLATDGAKTIAGLTWGRENAAQDASPMVLTSGTGLVITPANSYYGYSTATDRTCPLLRLPFAQIQGLQAMTWATKLRIWIASTTALGVVSRVFAAVDSGADVTYGAVIEASVWKGNRSDNTGPGIGCHININGVANAVADAYDSATFGAGNQTLMLELDRVDGLGSASPFVGTFTAGAWPSYYALTRFPAAQLQGSFYLGGAPSDVRNVGLAIGCMNADGEATSATIQRIRLDALL